MTVLTGDWRKLPLPLSELCLSSVLRCGQSFRWKSTGEDEWSCALNGRILSLRQDTSNLHYRAIFPQSASASVSGSPQKTADGHDDDTEQLIKDYFNLSIDLTRLYEQWSSRDAHFSKKSTQFAGIRMLRQDPWENLVSFICSTNNNIARISQMVDKLCITFGTELGTLDGTKYHDFPPPAALIGSGIEQTLRGLGFGYRAKYISQTAQIVVNERPAGWLDGLRKVEYREAHESLLALSGVGPKVADCVCLMSLDKTEAVPVDTHVLQIAQRDYKFGKGKQKSLTKAMYDAIGDHFRDLWGKEAGWAHSVLFTADLKAFSEKEVKVEETVTKAVTSKTAKRARVSKVKEEEEEEEEEIGNGEAVKLEQVEEVKEVTSRTTKRVRVSKVKGEEGVGDGEPVKLEKVKRDKGNTVKVETVKKMVVRKSKRKLGIEGEDMALELQGITMSLAERVKRRKRN